MRKKTKIIIIVFVLLIIISIVAFLFVYQNKDGNTGVDIVKNTFPFGKSKEEKTKLITIPPPEKIKKNNLSAKTDDFLRLGLSQFTIVKDFINDYPDINFSDNLKNIFVSKYLKLKIDMNGDELFFALWDFACGNTNDFHFRTAGLIVISYFFQQCDIFES